MNLLSAFFLLSLVANAISTEFGSVSFTPEDGIILPMEMALNNDSLLSIPSKPKNFTECFDQTINFHDFDKGLVALKEIQGKRCLVRPTNETFEENKKILDAVKNGDTEPVPQGIENWIIPKNPLKDNEVEFHFGRRIADFCSGYKVYRIHQGSVQRSLRVLDRSASSLCWAACGVCSAMMENL